METTLIIAFCIGSVAVFAFIRRKKDQDIPPQDEVEPVKWATVKVRVRNYQSAIPVPAKPVLQGSAFVVDGDTLVIKKTQIRLFGVDAPELNHPYGKKAKWALRAMCKGQVVRAEVSAADVHGRTVARCYLSDGRDISAEMVKIGLAIDWPKFSGGMYRSLELPDARKRLWLADARQKGRMDVWEKFEARNAMSQPENSK